MVRGVTTLKLKDIRHSDMEMFKISVSSLSDHKVWVFNGVNTSYSLNNSRKQTSDQLCVGLCHCDLMPPHFKTNQVSTGTFATYTMWAWKRHLCQSESNKLCAAWQSPLIQHVTQTWRFHLCCLMFVQRYSNVAAILHLMSSGVKTPNMVFLIHFNRSYTVRSFYCCDKLERLYSDTKEHKYDVQHLLQLLS